MDIKKQVFQTIKSLTKKKFDETTKIKEIGIDSLDLVEAIIEFEKEFKIAIADKELKDVKTVGDVVKLVDKYLK